MVLVACTDADVSSSDNSSADDDVTSKSHVSPLSAAAVRQTSDAAAVDSWTSTETASDETEQRVIVADRHDSIAAGDKSQANLFTSFLRQFTLLLPLFEMLTDINGDDDDDRVACKYLACLCQLLVLWLHLILCASVLMTACDNNNNKVLLKSF